MNTLNVTSQNESETLAFGDALGRSLLPGMILTLNGELGSGKTVLSKGICTGAGVADIRTVRSPSFCLCRIYEGATFPIFHVDAFRMTSTDELTDLGIQDQLPDGVLLVEWGHMLSAVLPNNRVDIQLTISDETVRQIQVECNETDPVSSALMDALQNRYKGG